MRKRKEVWINSFGSIYKNKDDEFSELTEQMRTILVKYKDRMSFKDLYTVASYAAISAVGALVRERVNSKVFKRRKKRS